MTYLQISGQTSQKATTLALIVRAIVLIIGVGLPQYVAAMR